MKAQHGGARVTPTLRLGEGPSATVAAEPTMEQLEALLSGAGYHVRPIRAAELHGRAAERPLPWPPVELRTPDDRAWAPEALGPRISPLLCFLHAPSCLTCQGWARQVQARALELEERDARPVFVLPAHPAALRSWLEAVGPQALLVGDPVSAWREAVVGRLAEETASTVAVGTGERPDVLLVVADRYRAPRAWLADREAGGLVAAEELVAWAGLLLAECPECGGEVGWPEGPARS